MRLTNSNGNFTIIIHNNEPFDLLSFFIKIVLKVKLRLFQVMMSHGAAEN